MSHKPTDRKGTGAERYPHLYGSPRWRRLREYVLGQQPLCVMCKARGIVRSAVVVDHIKVHDGDVELFYDVGNLQGLCSSCHSGQKRIEDTRGYSQACDVNGYPTSKGHSWNK